MFNRKRPEKWARTHGMRDARVRLRLMMIAVATTLLKRAQYNRRLRRCVHNSNKCGLQLPTTSPPSAQHNPPFIIFDEKDRLVSRHFRQCLGFHLLCLLLEDRGRPMTMIMTSRAPYLPVQDHCRSIVPPRNLGRLVRATSGSLPHHRHMTPYTLTDLPDRKDQV